MLSVGDLLGAREGSLSTVIALGADDTLANSSTGCGGGCSCVLYPPGDVFGTHCRSRAGILRSVDRLLLQQNQTASNSRLCGDCPVSAAELLLAVETSAI